MRDIFVYAPLSLISTDIKNWSFKKLNVNSENYFAPLKWDWAEFVQQNKHFSLLFISRKQISKFSILLTMGDEWVRSRLAKREWRTPREWRRSSACLSDWELPTPGIEAVQLYACPMGTGVLQGSNAVHLIGHSETLFEFNIKNWDTQNKITNKTILDK